MICLPSSMMPPQLCNFLFLNARPPDLQPLEGSPWKPPYSVLSAQMAQGLLVDQDVVLQTGRGLWGTGLRGSVVGSSAPAIPRRTGSGLWDLAFHYPDSKKVTKNPEKPGPNSHRWHMCGPTYPGEPLRGVGGPQPQAQHHSVRGTGGFPKQVLCHSPRCAGIPPVLGVLGSFSATCTWR